MGTHIQIRNVDTEIHRSLKVRAAQKGVSLSDYLKQLIERDLRKANWSTFRDRLEEDGRPPIDLGNKAADYIREQRESR